MMLIRKVQYRILSSIFFLQFVFSCANAAQLVNSVVDVKEFGAACDGKKDDTTYVLNALKSGATIVKIGSGVCVVDALYVNDVDNASLREITGPGTLFQKQSGVNVLTITDRKQSLIISNLHFDGVGGDEFSSNNSAIVVKRAKDITISNNTFQYFRYEAVECHGSENLRLIRNTGSHLSAGFLFRGCRNTTVEGNVLKDPQYSGFVIPIFFDSTDGHSFGINIGGLVTNNLVENYTYSQAYEWHAGTDFVVSNNRAINSLIGYSFNPYNSTDTLKKFVVTGNIYVGAATSNAPSGEGNYGIFIGGGRTANGDFAETPTNIIVSSNLIENANAVVQAPAQGGIGIGTAEYVTLSSNQIVNAHANGIVFNASPGDPACNSCLIDGGLIRDVRPVGAYQNGVWIRSSGNVGAFQDGVIIFSGGIGVHRASNNDDFI